MSTTTLPSIHTPSTSHSTTPPTSTSTLATLSTARAALEGTLLSAGSHLDSQLQTRAADLHANNAALAKQEAKLVKGVKALAKENDKLSKVAEQATKRFKEFGDLGNWADVLEKDVNVLEEVGRLLEGGMEEEVCGACGEDLAEVVEEGVVWCAGCDELWHVGCAGVDVVGLGEGEDREEYRCRECGLREDLVGIVEDLELGRGSGFGDESVVDGPGEEVVPEAVETHIENRTETPEERRRGKMTVKQSEDVVMGGTMESHGHGNGLTVDESRLQGSEAQIAGDMSSFSRSSTIQNGEESLIKQSSSLG